MIVNKEIYLQSCHTRGLAGIELLGAAQIHAGVGFTAIPFPCSYLSLPLKPRVNLCKKQRQQDYDLCQSSAPVLDFSGSIQQMIVTLLPDGYPDIHLASKIMGMSLRTLQRRLAEEGLTYSHLVEQVRFNTAVCLLQNTNLKILNIALELGYSDTAHFTRAFKRWSGISPRKFRCLIAEWGQPITNDPLVSM